MKPDRQHCIGLIDGNLAQRITAADGEAKWALGQFGLNDREAELLVALLATEPPHFDHDAPVSAVLALASDGGLVPSHLRIEIDDLIAKCDGFTQEEDASVLAYVAGYRDALRHRPRSG
jgi:hypothetical protein